MKAEESRAQRPGSLFIVPSLQGGTRPVGQLAPQALWQGTQAWGAQTLNWGGADSAVLGLGAGESGQ